MAYTIYFIAILLMIYGMRIFLNRRLRIDAARFPRHLQVLLRSGYNGGFCTFSDDRTRIHLEFSKYIEDRGIYGLQLCYPLNGYMAHYNEAIAALLNEMRIPTRRVHKEQAADFLYADFARDYRKAASFAARAMREIFGFDKGTSFNVEFSDLDKSENRLISRRSQQPSNRPEYGRDH